MTDRPSAHHTPRAVLLSVVGLHLVTETALTPFYPQLFRALYGIEGLAATGVYIWVCRLIGFLALPLWGLAARRWPAHRLVVVGLAASAVLDAALGLAPTYAAFTALSAAGVATNTALLLAYPVLVATYDGTGDRLPGVRAYVAVFHSSVTVSTLAGAAIVALPNPRYGISAFALLDIALAVACYRLLGRHATPRQSVPTTGDSTGQIRVRVWHIVAVAALAVVFELATNIIRPFFTEYAAAGGFSITAAALLFLLPGLAALAAMPLAALVRRALGAAFLPVTFVVAAAGLAVQAAAPELAYLVGGRLLFGVGLGLGQVALDLRMFEATGTAGPAYTVVETARVAALFVMPVLATGAATVHLALPLGVAALLYVAAAVLAPLLPPRPVRTLPKEIRVLEPSR